MRDLSLHLMDLVQNSVKAGATQISIKIEARPDEDQLHIEICDNGCGMSPEMVDSVTDPFVTSRTTRSVGLGIPLMKELCELTGGQLCLASAVGEGTTLSAQMGLSNMDRLPLGDISDTFVILVMTDPAVNYRLTFLAPDREFELDLEEVREQLPDVPINEPSVLEWLKEYIREQQTYVFGGILHEIIV
jgi:hypothetical protein